MREAVFVLLFFSAVCGQTHAQKGKYPKGIEHVIVIGIDGLSPDGIRNANTPVMDQMIRQGGVRWNVRTVLPSSSSPNWASMIMGAGVELHGVLDNDWERGEFQLPALVTDKSGLFPTIFSVIRSQRPAAKIGAVYHWKGFGRLFDDVSADVKKHAATEDSATLAFVDMLKEHKPMFSFLHLDHVDHAGHHDGHGTELYYQSVARADSLIGQVLDAVKSAGLEKKTLVIITADHGGIAYGHGGTTLEETEIAMILYGAGVKQGYEIPEQAVTYDLAATIAFALQIDPPYVWTGRPLKSAFKGFSVPANYVEGHTLLRAPVIQPRRQLYQQAGGLYINAKAKVVIEPEVKNSVTRYTLNGDEPGASSTIYTQPFDIDSTVVVKAKSFSGNSASSTSTAYFRLVKDDGVHGLNAQLYQGVDWKYLPPFKNLEPVTKWTSHEFFLPNDSTLSLVDEGNAFGVVFTGFVEIQKEGEYTFYLRSDDGSKLYVNDKPVVDNDGDHGVLERSGSVQLTPGFHPIKVEYFNGGGGFWLDAYYKGPGISRQLIPANKLYNRIPE